MFISKLSKTLNKFDQYGLLRINAWQSVMVAVCLFFINFIFNPPYMQQTMVVFMFGLLMVGGVADYNKRQTSIIIFTILAAIYTILINLVREYNLITVLMVGFFLACIFAFAKKYAFLAGMATTLHMLGTSILTISTGGNSFVYLYFLAVVACLLLLVLALMNLFPRVYYFRVWLRSYYLTLSEFEEHFTALAGGDDEFARQRLKHLLVMNNFTLGLDYKQHGFSARRINILLCKIYKFFIVSREQLLKQDPQQLLQVAASCRLLKEAISLSQAIKPTPAQSGIPLNISRDLQQLAKIWNKLCLQKI